MSRPEGSQAPELFYDENEAQKYDSSSRMRTIQVNILYFLYFLLYFTFFTFFYFTLLFTFLYF